MLRRQLIHGAAAVTAATVLPGRSHSAEPNSSVTVAAASDLKFVLEELAQRYVLTGATMPRLVFGSSGNLARQIQQGAPFDLFMSADERLIERLVAANVMRDRGVVYGVGYLTLVAASSAPFSLPSEFDRLASVLPRVERFAIANPEHAPFGRAALQAIKAAGLHDVLAPKLVFGESVVAALQFVLTGAAQMGISAQSLSQADALAGKLKQIKIDPSLHAPIIMRMALVGDGAPAARQFYQFLQSDQARTLFQRYGFGQNP
jgi:molybdate transport system substrate-binding protein